MTLYVNAHKRVKRLWGSARQYPCVFCGKQAYDWAYDGTDLNDHIGVERCRYSNFPEFYMPLCRPCHGHFDANWHRIVKVYVPPREPKPKPPRTILTSTPVVVKNPRTEAEWAAWERQRRAG